MMYSRFKFHIVGLILLHAILSPIFLPKTKKGGIAGCHLSRFKFHTLLQMMYWLFLLVASTLFFNKIPTCQFEITFGVFLFSFPNLLIMISIKEQCSHKIRWGLRFTKYSVSEILGFSSQTNAQTVAVEKYFISLKMNSSPVFA